MSAVTLSVPEFVAWTALAEGRDRGSLASRLVDTERFSQDAEYSELGRLLLGARVSQLDSAIVNDLAKALTVLQEAQDCLLLYRAGSKSVKGYLFAAEGQVTWIEVTETGFEVRGGDADVIVTIFDSLLEGLRYDDVVFVKSETLSNEDVGLAWSSGSSRTLRENEWSDAGDLDVSDVSEAMRSFVRQTTES